MNEKLGEKEVELGKETIQSLGRGQNPTSVAPFAGLRLCILSVQSVGLVFEQPVLAPESAAVAAERSTGVHDAVAGDEEGDPVASVGHPDGALGTGVADRGSEFAVGPRGTAGDGSEGGPDAGFEGCARGDEGNGEGTPGSGEIVFELGDGQVEVPIAAGDTAESQPAIQSLLRAGEAAGIVELKEAESIVGGAESEGTQRALDRAFDEGRSLRSGNWRRQRHEGRLGKRMGFGHVAVGRVTLSGGGQEKRRVGARGLQFTGLKAG